MPSLNDELYAIMKDGLLEKLDEFLKKNGNSELVKLNKETGYSPLMIATIKGNEKSIRKVINLTIVKNNINKKSSKGETLLYLAVMNKHFPITLMYMELYPNLKMKYAGKTLLEHTKEKKYHDFSHVLDDTKKDVTRLMKVSPKRTKENSVHIDAMLELYEMFPADPYALLLSNIVFTNYILKHINTKKFTDLMITEFFKKKIYKWKKENPKTLINKQRIALKAYDMKDIDNFSKGVQWPHIPLLYLEKNAGSCVDLFMLQIVKSVSTGKKFVFDLYPGSNGMLSHVELHEKNENNIPYNKLLFVVMSVYHVFRVLQILRYTSSEEGYVKTSKLIVEMMKEFISKCVKKKPMINQLLRFILTRNPKQWKKLDPYKNGSFK